MKKMQHLGNNSILEARKPSLNICSDKYWYVFETSKRSECNNVISGQIIMIFSNNKALIYMS